MVPNSYIIALIVTTLLLFYRLLNITNRYINIIINIVLSLATGVTWAYIIVTENNLFMTFNELGLFFKLFAIVIVGIIIGFILMVLTWKEPDIQTPDPFNSNEQYNTQSLIGMSGIILDEYTNGASLGKLDDSVGTNIIIYAMNGKKNDKFRITKIENGKIHAITTDID